MTNFRSRSQAVLSRVRFPQLSVQVSVQSEIYSVAGKTYRHSSLPRKLIVTGLCSLLNRYIKAFWGFFVVDPSITCPRWYFLLPSFYSSISTTLPLSSLSVTSQSSRQNMSQSTALCDPSPSCCLICHWSSPWQNQ